MEQYSFENTENNPKTIVEQIQKGQFQEILNSLCKSDNDNIVLNHIYFKHFASKETYNIILNCIVTNIDNVLTNNDRFTIHINMKNLTVSDIDKHISFLQSISEYFKQKYPNKLYKCYIYNPPFVFSKIYSMICIFIDKDTQKKIELVTNK